MEQKITAANGVNIHYYKLPNTHSICISLYVKTGTLYENDNIGISHFLEHLHFRKLGGRSQKELYYQLESIGGNFHATTYKELMEFSLSSSPKYFGNLARVASDLLGELEADLKDFAVEKKIVMSEIREENQRNDIHYLSNQYIWANTNLKNPILGSMSSIKNLTLPMLQEEKENTFTKDNVFFYVTGNFDEQDISNLANEVARYPLDHRKGKRTDNNAAMPDNFRNRSAFIKLSHRKYFMHDVKIAFDVDFSKVSRRELLYLDSILSDGLCSLLREEIIEKKGLIYSFSASIEQYSNIGMYYFVFDIHKSKLMETVECFVSVINKIKMNISDASMNTVRVFKTDNQLELLDDPELLNWVFAYENQILGNHYADLSELSDANKDITKEQLLKVANTIFLSDHVSLISIGNKKGLSEKKLRDILLKLG